MSDLKTLLKTCTSGTWNTSGKDVQWKLEYTDGVPTLYFQCTTSDSDWKENFKFWLEGIPRKPYKYMPNIWFAHAGFVGMWKSCREDIRNAVGNVAPKQIVGFSQGSALALLAAEDFFFSDQYKPEVTAFGCPKVFWFPSAELKSRLNVLRVSMHNDFVTKIPFGILGFFHVGVNLLIGPKRPFWSIKAHQPETYAKALGD